MKIKRFEDNRNGYHKFTRFVNEEILRLRNTLQPYHLDLGPNFKSLDRGTAQNSLAVYRMFKKFEQPQAENASERAEKSIREMFAYDEAGLTYFNPGLSLLGFGPQGTTLNRQRMAIEPHIRKALYEIRATIHNNCRGYALSLHDASVTTGKTYGSTCSDTSLYAKLSRIEKWEITEWCFDLFATIAYRNRFIKSCARQHFLDKFAVLPAQPWAKQRYHVAALKQWRDTVYALNKSERDVGFAVFKQMLFSIVTFVDGDSVTTVAKNNTDDRVIIKGPMLNMITQRGVSGGIKKMLLKSYGFELKHRQDYHKVAIYDSAQATEDLKNASNSNFMAPIRWLYSGTKLLRHIEESRSLAVKHGEEWTELNMVAPMGNGFTFELMSCTLLHVCRYFDSEASVFGDDIIVHQDVVQDVKTVLNLLGYQINNVKSFEDGNFRESCGSFVSQGISLETVEMQWGEDIVDTIILVNKIGFLADKCLGPVKEELQKVHTRFLKRAPYLVMGPKPSSLYYDDSWRENVSDKAEVLKDENWKRKSVTDIFCQTETSIHNRPSMPSFIKRRDKTFDGYIFCDPLWLARKHRENKDPTFLNFRKKILKNRSDDINMWQYKANDILTLKVWRKVSLDAYTTPEHLSGNNRWAWLAHYLQSGVENPKLMSTKVVSYPEILQK